MSTSLADLGLHLTHCQLQVGNARLLSQFYTEVLGMTVMQKHELPDTQETVYLLEYSDTGSHDVKSYYQPQKSHGQSSKSHDHYHTYLELTSCQVHPQEGTEEAASSPEAKVNCEGKRSCYWKIGVNLYDLKFAADRLKTAGVRVTDPVMIPGVGLLCHVFDPEGYDTELMQFTFEGSVLSHTKHNLSTIGQEAVFSVITLRVAEMAKSLRFYEDVLGLKSVCRQDQSDYGFDIYYLSCHQEKPPNLDIQALENVEWTYQRPYTLLELVANTKLEEQAQGYQELSPGQRGFKGVGMACKSLVALKQYFNTLGIKFTEGSYLLDTPAIVIRDPDNIPIQFVQS